MDYERHGKNHFSIKAVELAKKGQFSSVYKAILNAFNATIT